jgi:hypothetical protein
MAAATGDGRAGAGEAGSTVLSSLFGSAVAAGEDDVADSDAGGGIDDSEWRPVS